MEKLILEFKQNLLKDPWLSPTLCVDRTFYPSFIACGIFKDFGGFSVFWKGSRPSPQIPQKYENFSLNNKLYDATFVSSHGDSPYQVGAKHAKNSNGHHVVLKNLKSTIFEQNRSIHVVSEKGLYDQSGEN